MIRTITETEALDLVIPATDDLLSGFLGPVLVLQDDKPWVHTGRRFDAHYIVPTAWSKSDILTELLYTYNARLPLSRPEVQAHLVGWLGRGEPATCYVCGAPAVCYGRYDPEKIRAYSCGEHCGHPQEEGRCVPRAHARPPADLYHLLKPHALGGLPDWIRMALIAGSVERVAAGMSALEEVLSPWWRDSDRDKCGRGYAGGCRPMSALAATWFGNLSAEERAAFDADVIREPVALIDDTPTGRVIRFEVPNRSAAGGAF